MESDEDFHARVARFAAKLNSLYLAEETTDGIGECLLGYGAGLMLSTGNTEDDVRETLESVIVDTRDLRSSLSGATDPN